MKAISELLYFLNHHSIWSFLIILTIGIVLSIGRIKIVYAIFGLVLGFVNIFTAQFLNASFLNAYGVKGTAVVTDARETNSRLNDEYISEFDAVVKTQDGQDVLTSFSTMTASIYPIRNEILIPPAGETFYVKYIPGFEKNIVILREESRYGKLSRARENRRTIEKAQRQYEASPKNKAFRQEYLEALKSYIANPDNQVDTIYTEDYKKVIRSLQEDLP